PVTISSTNYADSTVNVKITLSKANAVAATVTANNRTYDGTEKPLVTVTGEATGGTMYYALGENATTAPADNLYTTSIPKATNVGTYYVWYMVDGDDFHRDTTPESVTVDIGKRDCYQSSQIPDITKYVPGNKAGEYTITLPALPNGAKYYFTKDDTSGLISTLPAESTENTLSFSTNSGKSAGTSAVITVEAKDAPNYKDYSFKVNVIVSEYTVEYDWPGRTNIWLDADNELAWSESGVSINRSKLVIKKNGTKVTNVSFTAKVDSNTLTSGENTIVLEPGVHRIAITGDDGKLDDWVEFKVIKLNEDDERLWMDIPLSYALPGVVTEPNTTVYYDGNDVTGAGNTKLWYRHEIGETHISPPRNDDELYANISIAHDVRIMSPR
ncbi:MAG: hypothetical protein K6G83_08310, partial [Lachnospiraceae bacterium]|nr:hypothetical protein [Lachnospiraceae bacterium]